MLVFDTPMIPTQDAPLVIQTSAEHRKPLGNSRNGDLYGAVGSCAVSPTFKNLDGLENSIFSGGISLFSSASAGLLFPEARFNVDLQQSIYFAKSQVIEQPRHGTLSPEGSPATFKYFPNPGFVGNDRAVFMVNIDGHEIKVIQYIKVVSDPKLTDPESDFGKIYDKYCPKGTWKISLQATDIESTLSSFNLDWTKNMVSAR